MLFSSSLVSQSREGHRETVLALPDWKVVLDVENSRAGAEGVLRDLVVRMEGGKEGRRTWTLPYRAVVLLCTLRLFLISRPSTDPRYRFPQTA